MIYLWELPEEFNCNEWAIYDRSLSPDRFLLRKGKILDHNEFMPRPHLNIRMKKNKMLRYDCLPNDASIPLVNNRLKSLLELLAPNDIQFFPAVIRCVDGEVDTYSFVNIKYKIIGIDHEKSMYTKMLLVDAIRTFKYLTYKPGSMGGHELARDAEYLGNILVSERLKNALEHEKVTGVEFIRPEEFFSEIYT